MAVIILTSHVLPSSHVRIDLQLIASSLFLQTNKNSKNEAIDN
jgi:hypothetical protein